MITRRQIEFESVILFFLAAVIGFSFGYFKNYHPSRKFIFSLPIVTNSQSPTPIPTSPPTPKPQITSQTSPDGKMVLTLTTTTNKNLSKTYTFVASNIDKSNPQTIYSATYKGDSMEIPFNAWSPDNRYVFITYTSPLGEEALTMRADGQSITSTQQFLNVTSLFNARATGNIYDQTTGWASETLLILNTKLKDGSKGPSYWFDVPSQAIIPLATEF